MQSLSLPKAGKSKVNIPGFSNLFQKNLACKSFRKRLERKPQAVFGFEKLILKPYRRDKPAQRLYE
jgi:hypothetical protein